MEKLARNALKLKFIQSCLHHIDSFASLENQTGLIGRSLKKHGICLISLEYSDDQGESLKLIARVLGNAHSHDSLKRIAWDVKVGGSNGGEFLARSHGFREFPLHTDCSYELRQPCFFGLQVIQSDRFGGGINLVVDVADLIRTLSSEAIVILQTQPVKIFVPQEFRKDKNYIYATILDRDFNLRYRKDLIDFSSLSKTQQWALFEFESKAYGPTLVRSLLLEKSQILLLNNKRFLHGRTEVKDKQRHLKRIRFFLDNS